MLTHLLGIRLADRFAAIAPVITGIPPAQAKDFSPARPIAVMMINGTADRLVPFDGGAVGLAGRRGEVISPDYS